MLLHALMYSGHDKTRCGMWRYDGIPRPIQHSISSTLSTYKPKYPQALVSDLISALSRLNTHSNVLRVQSSTVHPQTYSFAPLHTYPIAYSPFSDPLRAHTHTHTHHHDPYLTTSRQQQDPKRFTSQDYYHDHQYPIQTLKPSQPAFVVHTYRTSSQ